MKKFLCIVLCLSMIMSFAGVAGAESVDAAIEGNFTLGTTVDGQEGFVSSLNNFDYTSIVTDASDVFQMADSGAFDDVQTLFKWSGNNFRSEGAYVADFLYNYKQHLMWATHVSYVDDKGTPDDTDDDVLVNGKNDLALVFADVNVYLKRILNNKYGGQNLFLKTIDGTPDCDDYATAIASFIHNLLYPTDEYEIIEIEFPGTTTVSSDDFYGEIVSKSGMAEIIQYYWCNNKKGLDIKPLLYVLGVELQDVYESDYVDGLKLGKKVVSFVIEKILNVGPINYCFDLIWTYARTYHTYLREPTLALLGMRISDRVADETKQPMTMEDLDTLTGLANFIFNDFDITATDKLQFMTVPTARLGNSADTTELALFILTYLNMNVKYMNNESVLSSTTVPESIFGEDLLVTSFYKSLFLGEYTLKDGTPAEDIDAFVLGYSNMYTETIGSLPSDIFASIKRTLEKLFKFIADYFDNLFKLLTGEKNFGE